MTPEEKLKSLDIELSDIPTPLGSYVPYVRTGNLVYLSGMLPMRGGKPVMAGRVGEDVTLEDGVLCARIATINALAALRSAVGGLGQVKQCVKISGFVASGPSFTDQPRVVNGASDLLAEVFGESGRHARSAVGVPVLPLNSPVEIEFIFEVK